MSAERTDFVDVLPVASLRTGLSFVKGEKVGAKALALAAENIFSYAAGQFLPDEIPTFGAAAVMAGSSVDGPAAIAAFESVLPDAEGTMKAPVEKGAWKSILKTLLPFLLGLL
jgi:uncharacterized membrane protein YadS